MLYLLFIDNAKVVLFLDTTKFISLKSIKRLKIIVPGNEQSETREGIVISIGFNIIEKMTRANILWNIFQKNHLKSLVISKHPLY